MRVLYTLGLFAATVSAGLLNARERSSFSRYELSLVAPTDGVPFHGGALSFSGTNTGFYDVDTEPIVIDVYGESPEVSLWVPSSGGYLALEGDSGLRDLVHVAGPFEEEPAIGKGSGFVLEQRDGEERMFNVTPSGGEGQWLVENVGGDDYELKWWHEGFTISTVFPVQLVGRLTAQS